MTQLELTWLIRALGVELLLMLDIGANLLLVMYLAAAGKYLRLAWVNGRFVALFGLASSPNP